jgi:hypothetical protein
MSLISCQYERGITFSFFQATNVRQFIVLKNKLALLLDVEFLRDEADQQTDVEEPRPRNRTIRESGPDANTEGGEHAHR